MASTDTENTLEVEFKEASNNWNLEKLYIDLAAAKGKGLTPVEKKFLRGLLCGYSPSEIADQVYKSRSSSAVRVYLSNGLYKYIQELIIRQTGNIIKIKNWSRVTNLLEKAGYKIDIFNKIEESDRELYQNKKEIELNQNTSNHHDCQVAIDVEIFHGRAEELAIVERWIINENCRLVALLGMGGIGKTALAASTIEKIKDEYECVIWRSLRSAPPLAELLNDLIQCLSGGQETALSANVDLLTSHLMKYLRSPTARCLIVFDGIEAILRSCDRAGCYALGYECYGELFARIGEENHRGCLILTSREKPKEIASLEGEKLPVRTLALTGLKTSAGQEILSAKGLLG
ncbi:MAG: NB-ARC domain-containing protein, partial [Tolypothrix sp. Co-bin9]|nr:NB-ARC domain-containing protein [Tolypothrix sp. Co-bin9]